ncbi:sodium:solute symporter family protein [Pusillimonas caeni]|uniref:sodium:solute symporter family transporter n=1 Tax=Pusillimonas caeni TaxID=1348472 RepID=UPI000E5A059E|nr:sodium:solute symporter family protein [Pusillimonas caeni]TFL13245.1 sodium:solute symporter family protein [Pusillimonas caeni]
MADKTFLIWSITAFLLLYLVVILWVGKLGAKHSRSMRGYSIARGQVNPWIIGISFGATYASANLFLGVPGWAYTYGAPTLWWTFGCFVLTWSGLVLFARKFWRDGQKQEGALTLPHWLKIRYGSVSIQVLVGLLALFNIYYVVGQNVGLATTFEAIMGLPYAWGVILGVAVTVAYLFVGGAYAQYIGDGIQGVFMCVAGLAIFVSLAWTIGGGWNFLGELGAQLHAIDPNLTAPVAQSGPFYSWLAIISISWLLFTFGLLPHLMNKVLSIEKEEDLRPFILSSGITLFLLSCFAVFAGMAARVIMPNLASADSAIPVYIEHAFPTIVVALMIGGLLSAILSTTNSLYLGMSAIIGNDIYKPLIAPLIYRDANADSDKIEKSTLVVSRAGLIVVGVVSMIMSFKRPDSLALLTQFGISAIISGVIAPIALGYVWQKANRLGALASTIGGAGCYIVLTVTGIQENVFVALGISSIVGFVLMIVVCLATSRVSVPQEYMAHAE